MPYNKRDKIDKNSSYEYIKSFVKNIIKDKEKQIRIASLLPNNDCSHKLRDDLSNIINKYSQFIEDPIINEEEEYDNIADEEDQIFNDEENQVINNEEESSFNNDPIPESESELNDLLFNSIADSYTTVINENDEPVFNVSTVDENTISIKYNPSLGGEDKTPFVYQNMDQFMKPILLDIIDKIGFGEEDPEEKKQMLIDELKELLEMYRDSFETWNKKTESKKEIDELIYKRTDKTLEIASKIYDILKKYGLAGPIAEKQYKEISQLNNEDQFTGESTMANKKIFNLKKCADKLYDNIREKSIQKTDPQYRSRHGDHALPWYEDAYIPEPIYKNYIMDRYYPEQLNEDGEYRGGYINDRFTVHHNTEGNSMHIRPGEKRSPDRVESYSTERRLEEMRKNNLRGYRPSEGSQTEQQTKKISESNKNIKFSQEYGVYKITNGSKETFLDTRDQVNAFRNILSEMKETLIKSDKKKIAQVTEYQNNSLNSNKENQYIENTSPENPLLSIVNNLIKLYPNYPIEEIIRNGIVQLSSSGMETREIEKFRAETMKALGMPSEMKDYDQIDIETDTKKEELLDLMED